MDLELVKKEYKDIVNKAEKFFEPLHQGHSDFQIKHFILQDDEFPLPDSKYYQAMLEVYSRYENLISQHYEYKKTSNEIKLLEFDIEDITKAPVEDKRKEVMIDMKQDEIALKELRMKSIKKSVESTLREMRCFVGCMEELKPQLKYKDYESMQKEHWLRRYAIQKKKGERTCSIPREMLVGDESKKLLEEVK